MVWTIMKGRSGLSKDTSRIWLMIMIQHVQELHFINTPEGRDAQVEVSILKYMSHMVQTLGIFQVGFSAGQTRESFQ
jgi:hypothetical protein